MIAPSLRFVFDLLGWPVPFLSTPAARLDYGNIALSWKYFTFTFTSSASDVGPPSRLACRNCVMWAFDLVRHDQLNRTLCPILHLLLRLVFMFTFTSISTFPPRRLLSPLIFSLESFQCTVFVNFLALGSCLSIMIDFDFDMEFSTRTNSILVQICALAFLVLSLFFLSLRRFPPASLYFVIVAWCWCSSLSSIVLLLPFVHPPHTFCSFFYFPSSHFFSSMLTTAFLRIYRKMVNITAGSRSTPTDDQYHPNCVHIRIQGRMPRSMSPSSASALVGWRNRVKHPTYSRRLRCLSRQPASTDADASSFACQAAWSCRRSVGYEPYLPLSSVGM